MNFKTESIHKGCKKCQAARHGLRSSRNLYLKGVEYKGLELKEEPLN